MVLGPGFTGSSLRDVFLSCVPFRLALLALKGLENERSPNAERGFEVIKYPYRMVDEISALGLRHVGYAVPIEYFGPFVSAAMDGLKGLTEGVWEGSRQLGEGCFEGFSVIPASLFSG